MVAGIDTAALATYQDQIDEAMRAVTRRPLMPWADVHALIMGILPRASGKTYSEVRAEFRNALRAKGLLSRLTQDVRDKLNRDAD